MKPTEPDTKPTRPAVVSLDRRRLAINAKAEFRRRLAHAASLRRGGVRLYAN